MVSIVERLLVLNTFQKPPKSWLLNKSGCISKEVNDGARTVFEQTYEPHLSRTMLKCLGKYTITSCTSFVSF